MRKFNFIGIGIFEDISRKGSVSGLLDEGDFRGLIISLLRRLLRLGGFKIDGKIVYTRR